MEHDAFAPAGAFRVTKKRNDSARVSDRVPSHREYMQTADDERQFCSEFHPKSFLHYFAWRWQRLADGVGCGRVIETFADFRQVLLGFEEVAARKAVGNRVADFI